MNLQIEKLNELELETISAGEHKHIQVYSSEEVKQYGGLNLYSNQNWYIDTYGNYCVVTTYTDKEWAELQVAQVKAAKIILGVLGTILAMTVGIAALLHNKNNS